jgi:rhamnogalacturonyl hydrolase YesR
MKDSPMIQSAEQANRKQKKLQGRWSGESELSQSILIYCASLLERIAERLPQKKKRPRTAWQEFLSAQMRKGVSVQEASRLWHEQKLKRIA